MLIIYLICLFFTSSVAALEQYFFYQEEITSHWIAEGKKTAEIKRLAKALTQQERAEETAVGERKRVLNATSKALETRVKKFIDAEKRLKRRVNSPEEILNEKKLNPHAQAGLGESTKGRLYRLTKGKEIQFPEIEFAPDTISLLYASTWAYPQDPSLIVENNSDPDE